MRTRIFHLASERVAGSTYGHHTIIIINENNDHKQGRCIALTKCSLTHDPQLTAPITKTEQGSLPIRVLQQQSSKNVY